MPVCRVCGVEKESAQFRKRAAKKTGIDTMCRQCASTRDAGYRRENPERYSKYQRENRLKHRAQRLQYNRDRKEKNKECWQRWKKENPEKYKANYVRMNSRPQTILQVNMSRRIRHALAGRKSMRTAELVGCKIIELKLHIETQFVDGMTWDNYSHSTWHIDHIIPCVMFDLSDPQEAKKCFNYRNLRPLWASDNFSKHSLVDAKLISQYGLEDLLPEKQLSA